MAPSCGAEMTLPTPNSDALTEAGGGELLCQRPKDSRSGQAAGAAGGFTSSSSTVNNRVELGGSSSPPTQRSP